MNQSRTVGFGRVEFDVDWPPGHVACYVLPGDDPVLVDAGMADGGEALRRGLAAHGVALEDVEHLLLTHPHVDHVGNALEVVETADPTVYAPAGVEERFARDPAALGERVRENARSAGIVGEQLEEAVEMAVESLERDSSLLPPDAVDVWVEGDDAVEVGPLTAEAVHAPGHQADHLCYAVDAGDERALLAGDMAILPFRSVLLHDGLDDGVFEAIDAYGTALDRLEDVEADRVYPGHGPTHDDLSGAVASSRESLDRLLDRTRDLLADGRSTVPGVAASLAGERSVRYLIPESMSALAHLESTGRATVETEDGVRHYYPA